MSNDTPATQPFPLPRSWEAMPYGEHWSFAYTTERTEREDYDFHIEFNETVSEIEERAIIGLLEAAPKLLAALIAVKDAGYLEGGYQPTLDMVDAAITEATGRPA